MEFGNTTDGVYTIYPDGLSPVKVFCEQSGWTRVLNRIENALNFNKSWAEYKNGFGEILGNHWLGLEKMRDFISLKPTKMRFECTKNTFVILFMLDWVKIGTESEKYQLVFGNYTYRNFDPAVSFPSINGSNFSTYDKDQDTSSQVNCATEYNSGWWFRGCMSWCVTCFKTSEEHILMKSGWVQYNQFKILLLHN